MDATKSHAGWSAGMLHPVLEDLLAAYTVSMQNTTGVPCELLRAATAISEDRSNVLQTGPADCVPDPSEMCLSLSSLLNLPIRVWNFSSAEN